MSNAILDGTVQDQNGVAVPGALVYVFDGRGESGGLSLLYDSMGQAISNPVTTDDDGYWSAYAATDRFYTFSIYWGGRKRYVEANVLLGTLGISTDPNLRADLASTAAGKGASLVSFESGKTVQDLASTASGKGAALFKVEDGGNGEQMLGGASIPFDATADGSTDDRTPLAAAITRGAGKTVRVTGDYSTSAGAQWFDTGNSDPEPSALTVTTSSTLITGANVGSITVDTPDKSVLHVKNATLASRPTGVVVRDITLGQPHSTLISAGLADDYFTLRFEACEDCLADNVRFNSCEIAFTFQFAQTVTYWTTVTFDGSTGVSTANDTITATAHGLVTGDAFFISPGTATAWAGTMPVGAGLEFGKEVYAIVVDADTIKVATSAANAAAGTAIDITAVGSGTLSIYKDVRRGRGNRSRNCSGSQIAFMGMQIFGEREGVHTGHHFRGVDADGTSLGAAHGIRLSGFDFCPVRDNVVTGHTVARFVDGLSLQTYVHRNEISLVAEDCTKGCDVVRQTTRDRVQWGNRVSLVAYGGSYGLYDNGSRDSVYELQSISPSSYGIEAVNSGVKTFNGATAVTTGTDQIAIASHGFVTGDGVIITAGTGTLPTGTGISGGAQLYVIAVDTGNIKLATSRANAIAGTAIDITAAGSGTISLFPTDWNTNNSYRGKIITPGARGANLNSVCRTHVDLDIIGSGAATTTYGVICSGPYLRGRASARDCNVGVFLSGEFANITVHASDCTTPLQVTGHNNVIFCNVVGNISVSGNNNTIIGTVTGTVTNTGTGNRIMVAKQTGWTAGTGTANKGAFATYAGQTVSAAYVQAEAQSTDNAAKANSQRIKAMEDAMRNLGLLDG